MANLTKAQKKKIADQKEAAEKSLRLKNRKTTSKKEDIEKLAKITGKKAPEIKEEVKTPDPENLEQQHKDFKDSLQPDPKTEEVKTDETPTPEVKTEEVKTEVKTEAAPEKKKLSLWDDIAKPTNEDTGIKEQVNRTADTLNNFADSANDLNSSISEMEQEAIAKKESYKVKAGIIVELCDVGFMVVCLLLTWNFDDENQKKFTLNSERKNAIKYNLQKVYEMEGKQLNPKKDIMFLIVGSYIPMLLVAVFIMINNLKAKSEAKKNKLAFNQVQRQQEKKQQEMNIQLQAARYENEQLQKQLEISALQEKNKGVKREFIQTPAIGRKKPVKEKAVKVTANNSGRGVKPGTKRGSYNKNK